MLAGDRISQQPHRLPLDGALRARQAAAMSENPYAIPAEDLVASARVEVVDQVEEQAQPSSAAPDRSNPVSPYADGMSGDADGD